MTGHVYLSTACWHAAIAKDAEVVDAFHDRCRQACKFCQAPCYCNCHGQARREGPIIARPDQRRVTVTTEGQPE